MFIFLKSKKKKPVIAFRKKKVNKDTTIVLEVCGLWMQTTFPRVGSGGKGLGDTNRDPRLCSLVDLCGLRLCQVYRVDQGIVCDTPDIKGDGSLAFRCWITPGSGEGLGQRDN